jgi:dethiobiotin synthetase
MRPIFVTGTGTDVGKTHILCAMLEAHRRAGGRARIMKPVISGFDPAQLNATDTIRLMRANGDELTGEGVQAVSPWRFKAPLSPDMAAFKEGRELMIDSVTHWCLDRIDRAMPTVIEGAGGVMSPLATDGLNLDLIRELDARPILVAGAYLGAISHTLTALRVMDARCTVIVNDFNAQPVSAVDTARSIQRFAPRADVRVFSGDADGLVDLLAPVEAAAG